MSWKYVEMLAICTPLALVKAQPAGNLWQLQMAVELGGSLSLPRHCNNTVRFAV